MNTERRAWLALGKANELLGVHSTTLRGWVDSGPLHAFPTTGGHSHFMAPDLRASLHDRRSGRFGVITAEPADYARFFHGMLDEGFYIPPSQVEAGFLSLARTKSDTVRTVETGDRAFKKMALE